MLETTLCLLKKDNKILLAMKKRGFGEGKYNGVGGKIESVETPEEAMIRETEEEILVTPTKYEKVGIIEFDEFYKGKKEKVMFTGDFIFKGSIGKYSIENEKIMFDSLKRFMSLDNDITIYPGHGESSSVLYEKENNYFLRGL